MCGLFMFDGECVLFVLVGIDVVVSKNSGGVVIEVKFDVVCECGLLVVMLCWLLLFDVDCVFDLVWVFIDVFDLVVCV